MSLSGSLQQTDRHQRRALLKTSTPSNNRLQQLKRQGFFILENIADQNLLEKTRACVAPALASQDDEARVRTRSPGSLIDSNDYPDLADLIGNPQALNALQEMGLSDIRFWKAVIISKPPGGPRLYWHQDCIMWQDPRAYSDEPPMIFLMYYLEDTTRENGCIRVLPGTHRKRHELHGMGTAHTYDVNRIDNPNEPRFLDYPGEQDLPVRAGDLLVGDARMFHSTHQNRSTEQRTVITIWFHPGFSDLLPQVQSWIHNSMYNNHGNWPEEAKRKIAEVYPRYSGDAPPMELIRTPDSRLA